MKKAFLVCNIFHNIIINDFILRYSLKYGTIITHENCDYIFKKACESGDIELLYRITKRVVLHKKYGGILSLRLLTGVRKRVYRSCKNIT